MAEGGRDTILFLDRSRISVYDGNGILKLDLPGNIVRDMDVIDKIALDSLIDTFVKGRKLVPSKLWLVLADSTCFAKDFTQADPVKLEGEVKEFLEAVPFDQVVSKRYRAQSSVRVIATNYELLEAIGEIFERDGFSLEGIVPSVIFPGYGVRKILDADFARYIISNKSLMRQSNMLQKIEPSVQTTEAPPPEQKTKSRILPYLLVGFGILLLVLVATIVMRR